MPLTRCDTASNIEDFDADRVLELVRTLKANIATERLSIRQKGDELKMLLDGQYDAVLGSSRPADRVVSVRSVASVE